MNTRQMLITAAVAGILSAGPLAVNSFAGDTPDDKGKCQQSNKCKGEGACASVAHCGEKDKNHCKTAGNDCAGHNSCKNHAFKGTKADCEKVKGKWSKG